MRALLLLLCSALCFAQAPLPGLKVSENGRFLVTASGKPFFYLADRAWELFHRLDREQALRYLDTRARQGYTAIQAVALAELEGLDEPNAYGHLPLVDKDPARPAISPEGADYWKHVDFIVKAANARGLYIAFLPTWGSWVSDPKRAVFTPENAQKYGEFLGKRYGKMGIIWVLGGDRTPTGVEPVWRALAKGIAIGVSGREVYDAVLMTFHPRGGEASSTWFHGDPWLDFNMWQNGHGIPGTRKPWTHIAADYARVPAKPVMDGEPLYEDHPLAFRAREFGYSFDAHVRQYAWWDVFAGSMGHTYGNHAVWQMYAPGRKPINGPLLYWHEAILRPGGAQMRHLRALIESRPYLSRVPAQDLVADPLDGPDYIAATRGDGFAFVYSAQGRRFTVQLDKLGAASVKAWWYNPRSGASSPSETLEAKGAHEFKCPSEGFGSDWVLVLDDAARSFPAVAPAR